jgi:hypothetical protein
VVACDAGRMQAKSWWTSKTVWAGVVAALSGIAQLAGVDIADLSPQLTEQLLAASSLVGGVLAVWGRFRAHTVIVPTPSEPRPQ